MNKSYINRVKHKIFPGITDWGDPQNKVRFEKDVNKLSQKEWFWMHPTSYQLILYGSPVITIITMALLLYFFIRNGLIALSIIPVIIISLVTFDFVRKVLNRHLNKNTTMYDLHMRER